MNFRKFKFVRTIYKKSTINKFESTIELLGVNCNFNAVAFLNLRLLFSILLFFSLLFLLNYGYIFAPFGVIVFHFLIEYIFIDSKIRKRAKKLDLEAVYFFEVLTLSIESGRNLEGAISLTCRNIDSELSDEFKRTLNEVKFGKSLTEALEEMRKRIPSETINNIILNITQSNIFGNSIVDTLYNQIDFLNEKRILSIKSQINKIPTKISVISVVFFIPLIMLLILGPAFITYLK